MGMKMTKTPSEKQKEAIKFLLERKRGIVSYQTGTGKALKNGTCVRTIDGSCKPIEELTTEDYVLSGDGCFYQVTGVFPQGEKPLYKLTLFDGREIIASEDHLWLMKPHSVHGKLHGLKEGKWDTATTLDLWNVYKSNAPLKYVNIELPVCHPVQYYDKESTPELLAKAYEYGKKWQSNRTWHAVKDYWTQKSRPSSTNRQPSKLPEKYTIASIEVRYMLLAGIFENKGYVIANSKSGNLWKVALRKETNANELLRLCYSLGIFARKKYAKHIGKWYRGGDMDGYYVTIDMLSVDITKFPEDSRFMQKYMEYSRPTSRLERRSRKPVIKSIEPVGTGECTCISVDSPSHTFVTEDYIVTHNTLIMLCTAYLLLNKGKVDNVFIIGTTSALKSIHNELTNTFGKRALSVDDYLRGRRGLVLASYKEAPLLQKDIDKEDVNVLMLDEYHKMKSPKTIATQTCTALRSTCKYVYGFTATMIMKDIKDLYSLVKWMNPMLLGTWENFCNHFTMYYRMSLPNRAFPLIKPYRYRNLDTLNGILSTLMITYFPNYDIEYIEKFCELEDVEGYRKVIQDTLVPTGDEKRDKALPMLAVHNAKSFVASSNSKLKMTYETTKELIDDGVILYCDEYKTLDPVYSYLTRRGINVLRYTGKQSKVQNDKAFSDFWENPKGKALLISRVAGASLNLQATDKLIMVDMPSSIGAVQQLTGRIAREYSEFNKYYIYLMITKGSVEYYWYQYVTSYAEPLKALFQNGTIPRGMPSYNEYLKKELIKEHVWDK